MTVAAFFGYLFLSVGPPVATALPFFWHRSLLSLTVVTSMFLWLFVMIMTSIVFRAFVPLRDDVGPYAGLLITAVLIEEAVRVGTWFAQKRVSVTLKDLAEVGRVAYTELDDLALAYSIGWGQGFLHVLMQFLPFLFITYNDPTVYSRECPSMSLFLVSSLSELGMFAILAGGHVIFIYALRKGSLLLASVPPLLHFAASLSTLANFQPDGCLVTVPLLLSAGVLTAALAAFLAWRLAVKPRQLARSVGLQPWQ